MSIETWKKEFMPVPANHPSLDTDRKRLEHSLLKWRGLRFSALEAHGLHQTGRWIYDGGEALKPAFNTGSPSCALCVAYLDRKPRCAACPLSKLAPGGDCNAEYGVFLGHGDPEPMIHLLEKACAIEQ